MREAERELSEARKRLKLLEDQVHRRQTSRDLHRSPTTGKRGTSNLHVHLNSQSNTDNKPSPKKPRLEPSEFFEEFLNVLKGRSGDREFLSSLNNVVPEFDPLSKEQTIDAWLDKIEECAEIYSWNEKQKIHYALPKLTGHARTWYQGLPSIKHTWSEWKVMLKDSFPATENYADLLMEMLNRRARPGESLEVYYFAKINLLNRCKIFDKQAVDCLVHGIDDRSVRVGAQAAKFEKPEEIHEFFKTIKPFSREQMESKGRNNRDTRLPNSTNNSGDTTLNKNNRKPNAMTCFNCREIGHPSFKCPKPIIKCTKCNLMGHTSTNCTNKIKDQQLSEKDKSVLKVSLQNESSDKYKLIIKVNGSPIDCLVDLGSEATVIRESDAKMIGLQWKNVDGPFLRGLGNIPYLPRGSTRVDIEVQGILEKDVEVFIVDDALISYSVLLGHSFTERPHVQITKTTTDLKFERVYKEPPIKVPLSSESDAEIGIGQMRCVSVKSPNNLSGNVYVYGTVRGSEGNEYYLLPGEYHIIDGTCRLLLQNIGGKPVIIAKDTLITRARFIESDISIYGVSKDESNSEIATIKYGQQLTDIQVQQFTELLAKYKSCFSNGMHDLGFTTVIEMEICLNDTTPVVYRPYRLSYSERELVRDMVSDMMTHGIIRESSSPYASPIVLVQKKSGEKRLCVDYRALNSRTKRDHYPLPRIEDLLDQLSGSCLFTSLDLASGYHQIPIAEQSREKTAFVTPDGQYEYTRMPFGLANAPAVFQRAIHKILSKSKAGYVIIYMDDILIPSKDFEEGLLRLEEVLDLLKQAGLTLKLEKCSFFQEQIEFLGFQIDGTGVRPGIQKVEAVAKFPEPRNQHEVRRFIGLASFFRRFVKGFAMIARPLTNLLRRDVQWKWGTTETDAFETLKSCLITRPVLALYNHGAQTQVHTDASKFGVAGILLQRTGDDPWRPVAYFSRQTTIEEMKLHSFELETLAVVSTLSKFRTYLIGIKFTIVTDCNALRSTFTKRDLVPRISRWWIQFLEFDCDIEYRPGERMSHVDALSRGPIEGECAETVHTLDILSVSSKDWIATVQSSDEEVRRIKDILEDPETPKIADVYKEYKIKNGRVFRILGDGTLRWLVPCGVRWQILKANHDDVGHFGFEKTLERVRSHFWFPKMRKFIKKYVGACLQCAHHKLPSGAKEGFLHPIPKIEIPFHTLHADHLGPFPRSKRRNAYILVIVDAYTKYVSLTPVKSTKTKETIKAFRNLFSYFGSPTRIITDRGTSFTSKNFKSFVNSIGTKHILNSVATPRANGQVERYNRTILASLGSMAHGKGNNTWDELLPDVQLGINSTVHEITKKTPTELLFGRKVGNPAQGLLNGIVADIDEGTNSKTLDNIRSEASELIKKNQQIMKSRFDKRRKDSRKYKEGDLVRIARAVVTTPGQSKKLEAKCQGPYRIKRVLPNDRYLVEDTPLTRKGQRYENVVAVDKIFPWLSFDEATCHSHESSDCSDNEGFD